MTLTATDIVKIQDLYGRLENLHGQRQRVKEITFDQLTCHVRQGTSGSDNIGFRDISAEAAKEIREVIARDLRKRAAKIVETLHKFGCEAKLTEE